VVAVIGSENLVGDAQLLGVDDFFKKPAGETPLSYGRLAGGSPTSGLSSARFRAKVTEGMDVSTVRAIRPIIMYWQIFVLYRCISGLLFVTGERFVGMSIAKRAGRHIARTGYCTGYP
jgi:hypothetical protein